MSELLYTRTLTYSLSHPPTYTHANQLCNRKERNVIAAQMYVMFVFKSFFFSFGQRWDGDSLTYRQTKGRTERERKICTWRGDVGILIILHTAKALPGEKMKYSHAVKIRKAGRLTLDVNVNFYRCQSRGKTC